MDKYNYWLENVTPSEKVELLAIKNDSKEIEDRFLMDLAFGTAGMRGEIGLGTYRMNKYSVKRATIGLAKYIIKCGQSDRGVIISYDTRRFSVEFALTVAKVLSFHNIKSYIFEDVRPVAFCSYAIRKLNAYAGVMITASHNPKEYNGYKVYGNDGAQMSPEDTSIVVDFIETSDYFADCEVALADSALNGLDNTKLDENITVIGKSIDDCYFEEILKLSLSPEIVKEYGSKLNIVYTPIHGAGLMPVTTILQKIGINVNLVKEQATKDTEFSTVSVPNPENKDTLSLAIKLGTEINASVIIGTDPDCDRMGIAIKKPNNEFILLNGNQIGFLMLDYILTRLKETDKLPTNGAVIKTIVTTTLVDKLCADYGVAVIDVLTGFKFIGEKIKEWETSFEYEFIFGYEESYGYLRGTHARDKDAVVASMLFAEMVCYLESKGKSAYTRLHELFEQYGYYYEENISIVYKGIQAMNDMNLVMQKLGKAKIDKIGRDDVLYIANYNTGKKVYKDGTTETITLPKTNAIYFGLKDKQFLCARPSGTEPKLKLYALVYDKSELQAKAKGIYLLNSLNEIL